MTKAWWLGFPRFRCPHCGSLIEGVKFVGKFRLPRVRRESGDAEVRSADADVRQSTRVSAAAKRTRAPRRKKDAGVQDR